VQQCSQQPAAKRRIRGGIRRDATQSGCCVRSVLFLHTWLVGHIRPTMHVEICSFEMIRASAGGPFATLRIVPDDPSYRTVLPLWQRQESTQSIVFLIALRAMPARALLIAANLIYTIPFWQISSAPMRALHQSPESLHGLIYVPKFKCKIAQNEKCSL